MAKQEKATLPRTNIATLGGYPEHQFPLGGARSLFWCQGNVEGRVSFFKESRVPKSRDRQLSQSYQGSSKNTSPNYKDDQLQQLVVGSVLLLCLPWPVLLLFAAPNPPNHRGQCIHGLLHDERQDVHDGLHPFRGETAMAGASQKGWMFSGTQEVKIGIFNETKTEKSFPEKGWMCSG